MHDAAGTAHNAELYTAISIFAPLFSVGLACCLPTLHVSAAIAEAQ